MVKSTGKLTDLAFILVSGVGLAGYSFNAMAAGDNQDLVFTEQVIQAPFKLTHPLLPVDALPDAGKELLAFGEIGRAHV